MRHLEYFYRCSPEYVGAIDSQLRSEVLGVITRLRKRSTQLEINQDITWLLGHQSWNFSSLPPSMPKAAPVDLEIGEFTKKELESRRKRELCLAPTILRHRWVFDFSKTFGQHRVCLEAQFGKKEAALMDFSKLQIAYHERHLSLGIEMLMAEPRAFFRNRSASVSGMAEFSVAKEILPILGLECPVWLVGIVE